MTVTVEKSRQWSDETIVVDHAAQRWLPSGVEPESVKVMFCTSPNVQDGGVTISWGLVRAVNVNPEALVKALESLGYTVTK